MNMREVVFLIRAMLSLHVVHEFDYFLCVRLRRLTRIDFDSRLSAFSEGHVDLTRDLELGWRLFLCRRLLVELCCSLLS